MRILVADDHEAVRTGVRSVLTSHADIEICGEASNGKEAVKKARELKPDLIILDVTMPILGGMGAAKRIKAFLPESLILFFSMHDSKALVQEAKLLGDGLVIKSEASSTLLNAVDALRRRQTFFPNHIASN